MISPRGRSQAGRAITHLSLGCAVLALFLAGPPAARSQENASQQRISSEEFLASPFAKAFKKKQYEKALKSLEDLQANHPQDPLILRYKALTLQRLGRVEEAIALYEEVLSQQPDQASARVFMGRAYVRKGDREAAAEEFRRVVRENPSAEYRAWAQAELERLKRGVKKAKPKKRAYFVGKTGIALDSNPLLAPNDKTLRSPGAKRRGIDYLMEWTAGVAPLLRHDSRVDLLYLGQETLHNGGADQVNFTSQGFAIDAKKRHFLGRRAVLFGARYDFKANFLRSHLFSVSNRFFLGADSSFTRRTRTHLYTRFNILNFGRDGSSPAETSRDGYRAGFGLTQFFYSRDLRRFLFVKEEFNFNQTRGENFDRRGLLSRVGIHTPVGFVKKLDCDVSGGFDYGDYPDFLSLSTLELEQREDARWDIYSGLTYHWKPWLATRIYYRFIKSNNANNFFDRDRHLAGATVIFSF